MADQAFTKAAEEEQAAIFKKIGSCGGRLRYLILLSTLICGIAYCGLQKDIVGLYHDDGIYIVTAKSISQGTGYRIVSLPGSPPQTKYPILYPYVLSWIWSVSPAFPANIPVLKAANLIFLFFIVFIAHRFYCKSVCEARVDGYLYAALVGANPGIFSFVDFAVSDLLFICIVLWAYWLYSRNSSDWLHGWRAGTLGLIGVLAVLTRSAGIPLAVAGLVHFVWVRRFRELAIYILTFALPLLPWLVWRIVNQPDVVPSSLLAYYVQYDLRNTAFYLMAFHPIRATEMVWANVRYLFDSLDLIWLLPLFPPLQLRPLVLILLAVGLGASIRKFSICLRSFLLFYLVLILGWPFNPIRYALPIMPLLLLFVFEGIHTLQNACRRLWRGTGETAVTILVRIPIYLVLCLNIAWLVSTLQPSNDRWVRGAYGQRLDYSWSGFLETFSWIRSHTLKEDLLATAYDPMYYLYTGRKAIMPMLHKPETYFYPYNAAKPDVGSVEEIKSEFRRLNVRYVVTNPLDQYRERKAVETVLPSVLASYSATPRLVFTSRDGKHKIYEIPPTK
jgi:hypothetical protein